MFARVLFPTDFSAYANAVFAGLPGLKSAGLRMVVLVHVISESNVPLAETLNRDSLERVRWSAQEQLNIARMALEGHGLRVFTRIEYGSPSSQIVRAAEEERVDLMVMGTQGKTLAQELLLGSVAHEVVRCATVPVLIQKHRVVRQLTSLEREKVYGSMFTRVLHPTDFSTCADAAFQVVKRLKAAGTEEVVLLHVQDDRVMKHRPPEQIAAFGQEDSRRLERMQRDLTLYGLQSKVILRQGLPFRETLNVADEEYPCLIVVGSCGRSLVREMLAGSTFENVVRLSHQPVLVVRCPQGEVVDVQAAAP